MPNRRKELKPFSYTTTIRNPERISSFLNCILPYNGKILTEDLISKICQSIIIQKLYKPTIINTNEIYKQIYNDNFRKFSTEQAADILVKAPQKHKEAGFPYGWPSRFDTWYSFIKELGFIYYKLNEPIEISKTGYMLINYYNSPDLQSSDLLENVFLNALSKHQSDNPFRNVKNTSKPFILLLTLIDKLHKALPNFKGIYIKEIPFIICWPDNDIDKLFNYFMEFRNLYRNSEVTDEIIYKKCLNLLESDNEVRFKFKQITKESVDDFLRKARITGCISFRGLGRFIDFNTFNIQKINYVITKYKNNISFSSKRSFFNYISEIDPKIIEMPADTKIDKEEIKQKGLCKFADSYTKEQIFKELLFLEKGRNTKDFLLINITPPTRLEFLTSIALKQNFPNIIVHPNYPVDDEGLPTFTARGGLADILVTDSENFSLVEVTLMKNKMQSSAEIPAIKRHVETQKSQTSKDCFGLFIAPYIHPDTTFMIKFTKSQYGIDIYSQKISEFVKNISDTITFNEFKTKIVESL
jgi:hypothetical protein